MPASRPRASAAGCCGSAWSSASAMRSSRSVPAGSRSSRPARSACDPRNPLQLAAERAAPRGRILDARGVVVADNAPCAGRHPAPALPASGDGAHHGLQEPPVRDRRAWSGPTTGSWSGSTSCSRAASCCASSAADPTDPSDLQLSVDVRFQELAARLLGDQRGAVVAIEPSTGRILALVSTPGYDPARAGRPGDRRGATSAASTRTATRRCSTGRRRAGTCPARCSSSSPPPPGLESGAIDTDTTFADQPAQSRRGFRLDGFRIRDAPRDVQLDHPLDLFEAIEVSSNIWFAHAGLATGAEALTRGGAALRLRVGHRLRPADGVQPGERWRRAARRVRRPGRAGQRGVRPGGGARRRRSRWRSWRRPSPTTAC